MSTSTLEFPVQADPVGTNRWYLSAAPIVQALVHLCVPMAAAMIVGAVYNVINAGFIGSLHDTALLAAITFGTPLLGLVMAVGGVFGVGGGALVSRLLGAAEHEPATAGQIKYVSSFAVWGAVIVGAVFGGIGLLLLHPLVSVLGADAAAVPATSAYVAVMLAFVPVLAAAFCLEQLVRAEGAARQAMIGLIASTVASVVFDVLFILVLNWGVAGAALSTGLANLVCVVYFAVWLQRHSEHMSLAPRWFTLSPAVLKPVFGVGVGELLQSAFLIVTTLVLNNLAVAYGDGPLAAMGIAVRIAQVPEFLVMGVTIGVLPLLAYSYGKGDRRRLASALRAAAITVGGIGLIFSTTVFAFREQVFSAFSADRSVLAIGVTIITAQLVAMIANGFAGLITSLFQATGRSVPAMVMSMAQGVLFIPLVLLGNLWFGLAGIIWALTVTEGLVFLLGVAMWLASRRGIDGKRGGWKYLTRLRQCSATTMQGRPHESDELAASEALIESLRSLRDDDPSPVYVQIQRRIRMGVADGTLQPGDHLPSVRDLARQLSLAPNTVGRAYAELSRGGVVTARAGGGSEIAAREVLDQSALLRNRGERLKLLARQMAVRGLALGVEPDEIAEAVRAELSAHGRPVSGAPLIETLGQQEAPLLSARNRLRGRISALRTGDVMAEVTIDLREGTHVIAAVTRSSLDRLGLELGGRISAYVKATELTLGA